MARCDSLRPEWWPTISLCCCDARSAGAAAAAAAAAAATAAAAAAALLEHLLLSVCHAKRANKTPTIGWQRLPMRHQHPLLLVQQRHTLVNVDATFRQKMSLSGPTSRMAYRRFLANWAGQDRTVMRALWRKQLLSSVSPQCSTKGFVRHLHKVRKSSGYWFLSRAADQHKIRVQSAESLVGAYVLAKFQ